MNEETLNWKKIKKELLEVYEGFLKNPKDKSVHKKAIFYDKNYGGLTSYNDILVKKVVPEDIEKAINGLSTIYQYGMWEEGHEAFSNDKIMNSAKKILENLKKTK